MSIITENRWGIPLIRQIINMHPDEVWMDVVNYSTGKTDRYAVRIREYVGVHYSMVDEKEWLEAVKREASRLSQDLIKAQLRNHYAVLTAGIADYLLKRSRPPEIQAVQEVADAHQLRNPMTGKELKVHPCDPPVGDFGYSLVEDGFLLRYSAVEGQSESFPINMAHTVNAALKVGVKPLNWRGETS